MNNNEILEMNKEEKELDEKLAYVKGNVEQYKKQLQEYKDSHPEEFTDKNTEITDIHAIGSLKALRNEKAKEKELQDKKDRIVKIRKEEKAKVRKELAYVKETIEQYKKQLQEYKDSHPEEFADKNTQITDIHAIGSLKALRNEREKEKELKNKIVLLSFRRKNSLTNEKEEEPKNDKDIKDKIEAKPNNDKKVNTEKEVKTVVTQKDIDELLKEEEEVEEKPIVTSETPKDVKATSKMNVKTEQQNVQGESTKKDVKILSDNTLNNNVRITYSAKTDEYIVENVNNNEEFLLSRKEVEEFNTEKILEGKDLNHVENLDMNVLKLLFIYDNNFETCKTEEYLKISEIGKSQRERQNAMEDSEIEIEYNLKGLYDEVETEYDEYEDAFTKEEREKILNIANSTKKYGTAYVTKGIYVTIREALDNIVNKFKSRNLLANKEKEALPEGNRKSKEQEEYDRQFEENLRIAEEAEKKKQNEFAERLKVDQEKEKQERDLRKEEGYSKLVNREYLESLDEAFDKAISGDERE